MKRTIAAGLIVAAAFIIHGYRANKNKNYLNSIFAVKASANRIYQYDYLRILAVMMVIVTHAVQIDLSVDLIQGASKIYFAKIIYMICLACNLIYVMLSGALLLPYREEKLSSFYIHRISKIALPMVVYFIFYCWFFGELAQLSPGILINIGKRLIQGDTPESPHYWLLYTILSLYIIFPFLRYMLRDLSYRKLTGLVLLFLLFYGIQLFLPAFFGINFAVGMYLGSWTGVAIIGYWVTRPETRRYCKWIILAGIIAAGIMLVLIRIREDYQDLCCNCSPIMCCIAAAFFVMIFYSKIFTRGNCLIRILSKYSFSLILIHWWVLHQITIGKLNIRVSWFHGTGLILSLVVTLAISLVVAQIIDQLFLAPLEAALGWLRRTAAKFLAFTFRS